MGNLTSLFISSKMQELAQERKILFDFLPSLSDSLISLKPWVFEKDAPATENAIREVYLEALQNSALYIGLFWNAYGEWTIDEFERAGEWNIPRHIYVKDVEAEKRDPKLSEFLNKIGDVKTGITAKWFKTDEELKAAVEASLHAWVKERLGLRSGALSANLYGDADEVRELAETGLIGRDELRQQIKESLSGENGRLLLQAFGGTGKTALAAHTAYDWIEEKGGKVLWLRLGASSPDEAFEALAHPFGKSNEMAAAQGDAKATLLAQMLKAYDVSLVVLDDVWNGLSLQAIQKAIPRKTPLLVTARQRYPLRKIIQVRDLEPDDAVKLLRELAPDFAKDEASAKALCAELKYLAFAIEIAGRTMQAKSYTAESLRQQIAKTDITKMEVPLEYREQGRENIAALIQTTLDALPEEAKVVFLAWGAFWSPQITPELIGLCLALDNAEESLNLLLLYGLANLEEAKQYEDGRPQTVAFYRLHDVAFTYATIQSGEESRHKAIDACLAYSNAYKSPSLSNFAAFVPELDNFMGAANFAMQTERYSDMERFAQNLYFGDGSGGAMVYLGYYKQAVRLLEQAAQAAEKDNNKQNQGPHLGNLGNVYKNLGQSEQAIDYYQQALMIAAEIGDIRNKGKWLGNLGLVYTHLGKYKQAADYHQQALEINREIGSKQGEGQNLGNLGSAYGALEQYEQASDYLQQALAISREIGAKRLEGTSLGNLGLVYAHLGQYEQAIEYYQQALTIWREIGDKQGEGNTLNNLGTDYGNLKNYPKAIAYFEQALVIRKELGNPYNIQITERYLAKARKEMAKDE